MTDADVIYFKAKSALDRWTSITINSYQNDVEKDAVKEFLYTNAAAEKSPLHLGIIKKYYQKRKKSLYFYDVYRVSVMQHTFHVLYVPSNSIILARPKWSRRPLSKRG